MRFSAAILFAAVMAVLSMNSCKETNEPGNGTLKVTFKAFYDSEPLVFGDEYQDPNGYDVKVELLKYYISNLELVKSDGSAQLLSEILLIDHEIDSDVSYTMSIPEGSYTTLRFGLGVDSILNVQDPATYANDHPLSLFAGTYWTWASMYRFVLAEGKVDTAGLGTYPISWVYHTGLNELYREIELSKPVVLEKDQTQEIILSFDLNDVFNHPTQPIDLLTEPVTHTTGDPAKFELAERFTDNMVDAIE